MPEPYLDNRELSWLKFNDRVLSEARDVNNPLFERLNFAAIFQSNLDEFYMVRVGTLYDRFCQKDETTDTKTNLTAAEQLELIYKKTRKLEEKKDTIYREILSELDGFGIEQVTMRTASTADLGYIKNVFNYEMRYLTSPLVIDKRNPFPFLKNKELYAVVQLESKNGNRIGILPMSGFVRRVIPLPPTESHRYRFVLAEDVILHYIGTVFGSSKPIDRALFRITRNADLDTEERLLEGDLDFREVMESMLKKRRKLAPVRLQVSKDMPNSVRNFLCSRLDISDEQVFRLSSPLDLSFVYGLSSSISIPELSYPKLSPRLSPSIDSSAKMLEQIRRKDLLLSYPYDSIKPFLRLLYECADDPEVMAVRITLYRLARNSSVVEALVRIAESGKQVLVLVELRARFDEENNIEWSRKLQDAGCTVIFGPESFKVHSKLLLITRRSGDEAEYFTQVGTGNYNEKTAQLYTDFCLMTADREIGLDAMAVFDALSTGCFVEASQKLLVAPLLLRSKVIEMIDEQIDNALKNKPAKIICKLNSLTDLPIINRLVTASQAGVKIDLIVRGICCLIPGIAGYTENIRVISIVGRFLEHSRVYGFGVGDDLKLYISSADFMTRNTIHRVEVAAPVLDNDLKARLMEILETMLADNLKARKLCADGKYRRVTYSGEPLNCQEHFYALAYANEPAPVQPTPKPAHTYKLRRKGISISGARGDV